MSKKGRKWKGLTFWLMVVLLVATILLLGTVTAVQAAEVTEVKRYAPAGPASGAEFEVTLRITGELPLVVGIVETIPSGFSFESTTHPERNYSVSENRQKVAFAVIDKTEIKYRVRAPSSGEGTFSGTWIDMLSENEGSIEDTTVIVGGGGAGAIEGGVTPTPSPKPLVRAVTKAARSIPMMEAGKEVAMIFEDMDVSLIALKADNDVSDVKVVVERIERTPDIPEPSGVAHAYLDLKVENAGGAKIEGRIEFNVMRSWIADNNIDEATVTLYRYEGRAGWKMLPTTRVGEDDDFVYFEAQTPGFSLFVITGEKSVGGTPTPVVTSTATPTATPMPATTPTPTSEVSGFEANLPALSLILVVFFALVSLLVAYLFVVRKRRKGGDVE